MQKNSLIRTIYNFSILKSNFTNGRKTYLIMYVDIYLYMHEKLFIKLFRI